MRHRTRTEAYGTWLKIVKKTNPKTGRRHYSVIADPFVYFDGYSLNFDYPTWQNAVRDHFDPARNRGMKSGLSWKFSNKEQAEHLIAIALLKWGNKWQ